MRIHVLLASCLKYAGFFFFFLCVCQGKKGEEGGEPGNGEGKSGTRESQRKRERGLIHSTTLLRAAVALPDFPLDCFQLVLEPWAFWVLEASPDPPIPPAPHPAA